ncbi:uncharacterized protein YqgC (DUF456 family) [Parabacteroides sp. PFB2-12]|uniref:DUF456 domain-containing protein n=1 Tax=unclassified Parabacteroides TaxID=2649774 RepID=UPI002476A946|nr:MULTISPECIES: DUF456 domain-containing protein [unclassified Parabacteroides]MDH6342447.1 uncharacterized protein YqgC (DUF456 family) [Parabacteroides sp. PM6-13]MDH6390099.1 uncharacterized protein YqgC (DUF456 family) [Parabacteroides sp. PFB2-12]
MGSILLIILAFLCVIIGLAGSILPALPGPPVAYVALWLAKWSGYQDYSSSFLIWTAVAMIVITVIDNVLPPYITSKSGGSRYATIGSIIGMLAGIFFSAIGMLLGMLLGAFIGELLFARNGADKAFKAALGAFAGFLFGTGLKLLYCFYILYAIIF